MRFGIVGLGRIEANIARHATEKGHRGAGFDPSGAPSCEGIAALRGRRNARRHQLALSAGNH